MYHIKIIMPPYITFTFSYSFDIFNPYKNSEGNEFYDRAYGLYDAALVTRFYTQHALQSK